MMFKKRILLADDDTCVRESLARVLEMEHYRVFTSSTGRETVTRFAECAPELLLLDLNMPQQNGWEAFEAISELNCYVPVIVITARPHQYERAVGMGIDALMEKPLDLPLLLQTVARLINEPKKQRMARLTNPNFATEMLQRGNLEPVRVEKSADTFPE